VPEIILFKMLLLMELIKLIEI